MKIIDMVPYVLSTPLEEPFAFSQGRVYRTVSLALAASCSRRASAMGAVKTSGIQGI
jgi:hypothetical protein